MKLCRFDLIESPGQARSGMVYGGKVYETDGSEPIAVHEWTDARLLSPIAHAPSIRLFLPNQAPGDWSGMSEGRHASVDLPFTYLNSSAVVGPQMELMTCHFSEDLSFRPCIAAVVAFPATLLDPQEAEAAILGVTLVNVFFAKDVARMEAMRGLPPGRSHDVGIAVGPAITTPDELEASVLEDPNGRRYDMTILAHVNETEVARFDASSVPFTLAEAVSFASSSAAIRSGDLVCIALGEPELAIPLRTGDEVRVVSDRLGTLVNRIG